MNTLLILFSLFIIVLVGMVARKYKLLPEESSRYFNKFIFYVSIPAAVFISLAEVDSEQLASFVPFVINNTLIIFLGYLLTFWLTRYLSIGRDKKGVLIFAGNGGNVIYFGFPILMTLYGAEHFNLGVIYATVVISIGDLLGFYLLEVNNGSGRIDFKKMLIDFVLNPVVLATTLGVIFAVLKIGLPEFVTSSMNSLSKTSTGLALFSLGIYLYGKLNLADFKLNLLSSAIKLIFLPLLTIILSLYLFKMDRVTLQTSVLMAAMPSAVFSMIVADAYNLDRKLTSNTIILSSLLFLITSGLWVWVLQYVH